MNYLTVFLFLFLSSCSSQRPTDLGPIQKDGVTVLKNCPPSPNCVISFGKEDDSHFIDPIKFNGPKDLAFKKIIHILEKNELAKIINQSENYIYAEFKTPLLGFIDDVEILFSEPSTIHFRSASRLGYSDLGANRTRVNEISFKFHQSAEKF